MTASITLFEATAHYLEHLRYHVAVWSKQYAQLDAVTRKGMLAADSQASEPGNSIDFESLERVPNWNNPPAKPEVLKWAQLPFAELLEVGQCPKCTILARPLMVSGLAPHCFICLKAPCQQSFKH